MPSKLDLPAPWAAFLAEVDQSLSGPVELHCVGGFALTVAYGVPRSTGDLDFIAAVPTKASEEVERLGGRGSRLAHEYKVSVQSSGGVTDFPEGYEGRLTNLNLGLRNLVLKVLEPYDLVLSKLTRNNPKDREDVKYLATKLNLSFRALSERYAAEMKPWLPNPDRHELTLTRVWREYFEE